MQLYLDRILQKLGQLRIADPALKLFGAASHGYRLKPPLPEPELRRFEDLYGIRLPEEYAAFLIRLGNGGAGPFYGLDELESSVIRHFDNSEPDRQERFDLGKPFPFTSAWNAAEELAEIDDQIEAAAAAGNDELEEALFEKKMELIDLPELDQGRIRLSDYGCGTTISLVVNGPDKGVVWTDDRSNDAGLYPSTELGHTEKTGFLDWYEAWLDQSLEKAKLL